MAAAGSRGERFAMGIELLTGLAIGAAALAAFVSFALALFTANRLRGEVEARAQLTASMVAELMGDAPTRAGFQRVSRTAALPEPGWTVALVDRDGKVLESSGELFEAADIDDGDWFTVPLGSSGLWLGVHPDYGAVPSPLVPAGLGLLAAGLTALALLAPGHLRRRVLEPLRSILEEAESYSPGDGRDATAASDSYRKLVRMLQERERTLSRLRREAERRADLVENRSQAILQAMGSAVLTLDSTGAVELCNPVARKLLMEEDGIDGSRFERVATALGMEILRHHPPGSGEAEFQLEHESHQGRRVLSVAASTTADGETTYLLTDVTGATEMERRVAEEKAMADLGAVSAGVSHEMGNSLCAIGGFLDLLARGGSSERDRKVLEEARREVAAARRMVESFRSMAGPSGAELEPMTVARLLEIVEETCAEMDLGMAKDLCPGSDSMLVSSHPELMRRCLGNLLKNAREADGGDGVEVAARLDEEWLEVEVADRGPGLSHHPDRLFSPFFSTKDEPQGANMGLGLTITRRIVGVMGGAVEARNRKGGGAVFLIRLPIYGKGD